MNQKKPDSYPIDASSQSINESTAMQRAFDIGHKVRHNFDWANVFDVMTKVKEELDELEQSLSESKNEQVHELGDLLFTIVQVARHLDIKPEDALDLCNQRHSQRMSMMRKLAEKDGHNYEALTLETLESYWSKAKTYTKPLEAEQIKSYLEKKQLSTT